MDGKLYALGGINHRGDALNSVEVLDLEAGRRRCVVSEVVGMLCILAH